MLIRLRLRVCEWGRISETMTGETHQPWLLTQPEGIITAPCWHYRWHYKDRIELDVIIFWLTLGLTIHIVIWVLPFFFFLQCKIVSYMFSLHIQGNYTSYLEVQLVFNDCWIISNLIVVVSPHFTSVWVNEREESVQAGWIVPCITLYCSFPSLFKPLFPGDKNLLLTETWSRHSTREKTR